MKLRRDETPNPTPRAVRDARRRGDLLEFATSGATPDQVAAKFGYSSPDAATRAIGRARDRVFPFDLSSSIRTEARLLNRVIDSVMRSVHPGRSESQALEAAGLVIKSADLSMRHRAALTAVARARLDPAWVDLQTADLGVWTPELRRRSQGYSFHDIAARLGEDDWFSAAEQVAIALVRFEQGCAVRLRVRQIATLDLRLHDTVVQLTRGPSVDLGAASRALTILEQRLDVHGIGLPFPGPLIEHPPTVRHPTLPPPSWKRRSSLAS